LDTKAPDGTVKSITSTAVFDESGRLKFEPLMYFTPTEVFVGGSHHILEVKNALGWTVVRANIAANVQSSDKCIITTPQDRIALRDSRTLPVWHVYVHPLKAEIIRPGQCETNPDLQLECADVAADVYYAAFFPNWKVEPTSVEVKKGDMPMSTGNTTIYDQACADGRKDVATSNGGSGDGGILEPFQNFFDQLNQLNPFKHLWTNIFEYF
jgi:hypothetical protein